MIVWVRVASSIRCGPDSGDRNFGSVEMNPELTVTIYHSKQEAEKARSIRGGVVLEVNVASLNVTDQNEFGDDVTLTSETADEHHGASPSVAYFSVCYAGLPYKMAPGYVAEFGPEADVWLSELEKEAGFRFIQ